VAYEVVEGVRQSKVQGSPRLCRALESVTQLAPLLIPGRARGLLMDFTGPAADIISRNALAAGSWRRLMEYFQHLVRNT
jgi:hypothetical protein